MTPVHPDNINCHCTDWCSCLLQYTVALTTVHVTNVWSHHFRRGGQWLTCRTHASLHGIGNVSVSVSIDKAHLHKDLQFEYVEDPTITKIEPEWSIYRYVRKIFQSVYVSNRSLHVTHCSEASTKCYASSGWNYLSKTGYCKILVRRKIKKFNHLLPYKTKFTACRFCIGFIKQWINNLNHLLSFSGYTPVTVTGTNLDIIQTPLVRAKYNGHETLNVSECRCNVRHKTTTFWMIAVEKKVQNRVVS